MSDAMPEPDRLWTVGTAPGIFPSISHGIALFRRPLAFLNSLPARGDLVEIRLGPLRAWMVCHPELVHQMLMDPRTFDKGGSQYDRLRALMGDGVVTCRQEGHRRQRTLLQPDFRASRVADYTELMGEEAESVCRTWRAGQRIDVSAAMMALTTRVTSRVLLSDSLDDARAARIRSALGTIVRGLFVRTVVPVDAPFRVPTPANRRYRRAVDRLHGIIDSVIAERRRGAPRDDVLAQHPETERQLHAEVDTVLAGGRRPGLDDLSRLTYTRSAVTETLRHSPPGWLFTRVTTKETELAGCRLPRGATVLYSPYLLHHDPASFPDPELFLPERWLPGSERTTAAQHRAMLPFATGSRKCIGDAFAMAEATVAIATIAGHWRLRHPPGPVQQPRPAVTLGPRSLPMICEPRSRTPVGTPPRARSLTPRTTVTSRTQDPRTAGDNGVDDA